MITISEATSKDFKTIREIAYKTWPDIWRNSICSTIEYMLKAFIL
jgi:isopentenyldiphosphate isomerase